VDWATIQSNLNTIKATILPWQHLFVDEILPWTNGTDAQVATVRTFNANLAVWCAANGATLVPCWGAMGQLRPSTGYFDDLKAVYDQDGVHLKQPGVDQMAAIWKAELEKYYNPRNKIICVQ
jgi:hypothetical protein